MCQLLFLKGIPSCNICPKGPRCPLVLSVPKGERSRTKADDDNVGVGAFAPSGAAIYAQRALRPQRAFAPLGAAIYARQYMPPLRGN